MESLPIEILENILSRLPSVSTLQCKHVCKTWRTLIGKSKVGMLFALRRKKKGEVQLYYQDRIRYHHGKVNLERYEFDETLIQGFDCREASLFNNPIVGSCNGLFCFLLEEVYPGYPVCIVCNPVTGEYVQLLRNRILHSKWQEPVGGFGYVKSTSEYKAVRIYRTGKELSRPRFIVHVYTLGSQVGWRIIDDDEFPEGRHTQFKRAGIFSNGAIHWLECIYWMCEVNIMAFDLAEEKFKSVRSPSCDYRKVVRGQTAQPRLALLGGNLCVVFHLGGSIDIWAFKKKVNKNKREMIKKRLPIHRAKKKTIPPTDDVQQYYDRTWRWSKEFSIPCKFSWRYNPVAITENNEVLLWDKDATKSQSIYCYDPVTSTLNNISDTYSDTYGSCVQLTPHMNTLVSLKDLGEF